MASNFEVVSWKDGAALRPKHATVYNEFKYDNDSNGGILNKLDETKETIDKVLRDVEDIEIKYKQLQNIYEQFTDYNYEMNQNASRMISVALSIRKTYDELINNMVASIEEHMKEDASLIEDLSNLAEHLGVEIEGLDEKVAAKSIVTAVSASVKDITESQAKNPSEEEVSSGLGDVLERTGATAGTFVVSAVEGVGQFGEGLVDAGATIGSILATPFTGLYDFGQWLWGKATGDEDWTSATKSMWSGTREFVETQYVKDAFDNYYENSSSGQWLKENAYYFDTVRKIGNSTGYVLTGYGVTAGLGALAYGTSATTGASTVKGFVNAASSYIKTKDYAVASASLHGLAGVGKNTERAWNNGASTAKGVIYGTSMGMTEGLASYGTIRFGQNAEALKIKGKVGSKVVYKSSGEVVNSIADSLDTPNTKTIIENSQKVTETLKNINKLAPN